MNDTQRFWIKHATATAVMVGTMLVLTVVGYFTLLLCAALTDRGMGSPLILPILLLGVPVFGVAATACLSPITAAIERSCSDRFRLRLVFTALSIVVLSWSALGGLAILAVLSDVSVLKNLVWIGGVTAMGITSQSAYWCTLQLTEGLIRLGYRVWQCVGQGPPTVSS